MLMQEGDICQAVGELYLTNRLLSRQIETMVKRIEELGGNREPVSGTGLPPSRPVAVPNSANDSKK